MIKLRKEAERLSRWADKGLTRLKRPLPASAGLWVKGYGPQYLEKKMENVNFGKAIEELKAGRKCWREGWNGKGMWLIYVPGTKKVRPVAGTPYSNAGLTDEVDIEPHIDMYTADGKMQPGWLASQTDMLAEDWCSDRVY